MHVVCVCILFSYQAKGKKKSKRGTRRAVMEIKLTASQNSGGTFLFQLITVLITWLLATPRYLINQTLWGGQVGFCLNCRCKTQHET